MLESGTGAQRVRRRRGKMRAAGLRPVQIWVPDTRAPGFRIECARQAHLIAEAAHLSVAEDEAWWLVSDTSGWAE